MVLNQEKCEFGKKEIEILGHVISGRGIKPLESRVEAIKNFINPRDVKELQSFLGLVNYCRKFIPDLSIISKPLYDATQKQLEPAEVKKMLRSESCVDALKKIRDSLSHETLLTIPNRREPFILTTDASNIGVGAILSQIQDGSEKIVAFYSSVNNKAEARYSTTEQELLAIVQAIKNFRHYLLGHKFTLRTDHKALIYLCKSKDANSRLFRWFLSLQEFDFEVEHIQGRVNFTDFLSRSMNSCNFVGITGERPLVLPYPEDRQEIIKSYHIETGHGREEVVKYQLARRYKWDGMNKEINEFIKKCEICQKCSARATSRTCYPNSIREVNKRWELDLVGQMNG